MPLEASLIGPSLQRILTEVTGSHSGDPLFSLLIEHFKSIYDESYCRLANPYDGVNEVLDQIRSSHLLMIATNKRERPTQRILRRHFWSDYFEEVFCSDRVGEVFKSKTEILEALVHRMGIERAQIMYIGDREEDLVAARTAGVRFALAGWGYLGSERATLQMDEFHYLRSPAEILSIPDVSVLKKHGERT